MATVQVLTMGAPNLDFTPGSGGPTCTGASVSAGSTCIESVTFTPSAPGIRLGAVVLLDGNGNILASTFISGIGQGGLGVLVPGNVIPVAGTLLTWEQVLDGSIATAADLDLPAGVTLDGVGNMYIADSAHNRIRMVCGGASALPSAELLAPQRKPAELSPLPAMATRLIPETGTQRRIPRWPLPRT